MPAAQALQLNRVALVAASLDVMRSFYEDALGFSCVEESRGLAVFRLGAQALEIRAADGTGRRYPRPRAANDPWFQHFAVVVADMPTAYRRLEAFAPEPISHGGPQLLPPSTGSVTAYKFRDPEGRPLELSHIPDSDWDRTGGGAGPFLGIDHSAVAVRDLKASVAFYTEVLGFRVSGRSLNQGPEQDRLDGLEGAVVDIVSVSTTEAGPHIELLHYRTPAPRAAPIEPRLNDIAATRLVVRYADLQPATAALQARGLRCAPCPFWPGGVLTQDPDGHFLTLIA